MARASYGFSTLFETMAQIRRTEEESSILNDFAAGLMEYSVLDAEEDGLFDTTTDTVATGPEDVAIEAENDPRIDALIEKIPEDDDNISLESVQEFEQDLEAYMACM